MNTYIVSTKIIHAKGKNTVKKRNESFPINRWVGNTIFLRKGTKIWMSNENIMQVYTPSMQIRYEIIGQWKHNRLSKDHKHL